MFLEVNRHQFGRNYCVVHNDTKTFSFYFQKVSDHSHIREGQDVSIEFTEKGVKKLFLSDGKYEFCNSSFTLHPSFFET